MSSDISETPIDITADLSDSRSSSSVELSQIAERGARLLQIESAKAQLQKRIDEMTEEEDRISKITLPALMQQIGVQEFTLTTGERILVKPIISASIPSKSAIEKERDSEKRFDLQSKFDVAMEYLVQNNAEAIIKNFVVVALGKDSDEDAKRVVDTISDLGFVASLSKGVHPSTLTSWVKERLTNGDPVDFEILSVYSGKVAEIKKPGKK